MKKAALLCLMAIALSACKKDRIQNFYPPPSATSHYPLSVGSYWIYEHVQIDSNGVETLNGGATDSVYISNDTVINGNAFAVFTGTMYNPSATYFRRDSLGYIVDQTGRIHFSTVNFTDTLWSSHNTSINPYDAFFYMNNPGISLIVPAGTFQILDFIGEIHFGDPSYPWSNPRFTHEYYGEDVGLVKKTVFYNSSYFDSGRRLVRYHIE